ncbi:protogenin isoform X2 [Wyeomyia smithii]|uniref:protogenin isoform X2 n=1 Tax=Wyeomyia smithii TaxID=174621 RepID=UPI002467BF08|nr:protogenin isoform X2 [Wyeomyia smithii]
MALLVRYLLLFALILQLLNGFTTVLVSAFVNKVGPDRLRLTVSPPRHIIITAIKNSPVYLPCHAEADVDDWVDSDIDVEDVEYENNDDEVVDILQSPIDRQGFYDDVIDLDNLDHDNINTDANENILNEKDEYDEETSDRYRRSIYSRDLIEYVWYRNGLEFFSTSFQNQNHKQTHKGFRLFPNGTLKIPYNRQMSNISSGVYRCRANLTRHGSGSILSTESVVSIAYLERNNGLISQNNTIVSKTHNSLVLHCPFDSHPPANVSWMVNRTQIFFNNNVVGVQENRYYQLQNGSLLIVDIRPADNGRYRCNATNTFATKSFRSYGYVVVTMPHTEIISKGQLLPRMQETIQKVHAGATLKLNCAGNVGRPQWTFLPRHGKIPIQLTNFTYQLKFSNVSVDKHEGIYNCSLGADSQLFNVTILVPPMFLNNMTSYTSSVVASMSFNCSVSGNPQPKVTWYKNGREIKNNYIVHYSYPILRIHTIDPEDEGLYQCIAKNEAGETSVSMYLSIRDKDKYKRISKRPENIQCFPLDTTSLYVRFDRGVQYVNTEYVMYYLASENPYSWYSSPPTQLLTNNSMKITGPMVTPFQNYTVYLRACTVTSISEAESIGPAGKKQVIPSKLSKGVKCTSQGVPVLSTFFPNGIFIGWPRYTGVEPTAFIIQFKHDNSTSFSNISTQINGTRQILDDYITHEEVEPLLTKINITTKHYLESIPVEITGKRKRKRRRRAFDLAKNPKQIFESLTGTQLDLETYNQHAESDNLAKHNQKFRQMFITQIKVSGNVTGILIPDKKSVIVRILGSVALDGEPMKQDLRFVQWKTIDLSIRRPDTINRFQANHIDARSVQFTWIRFIATDLLNKCLMLCYKNVNHDVFIRGGSNRINCLNIPKDATHFNLIGLLPYTLYKAFLKPCHSKEPISDVVDFQTKQDVPGPVTNHALIRKDGITITWGPPENRNGILQGYLIEWVDKDKVHNSANLTVSANHFQFPNISTDDKINISIRAIGSTGIGIPIYMNLLNHVDISYESDPEVNFPWLQIIIGTFLLVLFAIICCVLVVHRNNCQKTNFRAQPATPMALQAHSTSCNADIHEMQTLIRTSEQLPVSIPNGNYKQPQNQKPVVHRQVINTVEGVQDHIATLNLTTSLESANIKTQSTPSFENGVKHQTNITSPNSTTLLPIQQLSVSSQVLNNDKSIQHRSPSKVSSPIMESRRHTPFTSSNSIYNKPNSSYMNLDQNCALNSGTQNGKRNQSQSTGLSVQLQPKHSSIATSIAAEQVRNLAPTSTSLTSSLNCSTPTPGVTDLFMSFSSVQPLQFQPPKITGKKCYATKQNNNSNGYAASNAASEASNVPPSGVRITENPQYSKKKVVERKKSPAAVENASLFDSSQCRLLDLTIDSNSLDPCDDDETNCDQNDEANHSRSKLIRISSSGKSQKQQRPSLQRRLPPAASDMEEDDNNNEQHDSEALANQNSGYRHLRHHQLLNPRHLTYQRTNYESSFGGPDGSTHDISHEIYGDKDNTDPPEEIENSASLLNDNNLSSKPLHQQHASSWSFRRPIVGPNG